MLSWLKPVKYDSRQQDPLVSIRHATYLIPLERFVFLSFFVFLYFNVVYFFFFMKKENWKLMRTTGELIQQLANKNVD